METKTLLSKRGEVDNKFETYVSHTLVQRGVFHQRRADDAYQQHTNIMVNIRGIQNFLWGIRWGSAGDPRGIRMPL